VDRSARVRVLAPRPTHEAPAFEDDPVLDPGLLQADHSALAAEAAADDDHLVDVHRYLLASAARGPPHLAMGVVTFRRGVVAVKRTSVTPPVDGGALSHNHCDGRTSRSRLGRTLRVTGVGSLLRRSPRRGAR